jgi:hypothetical protein
MRCCAEGLAWGIRGGGGGGHPPGARLGPPPPTACTRGRAGPPGSGISASTVHCACASICVVLIGPKKKTTCPYSASRQYIQGIYRAYGIFLLLLLPCTVCAVRFVNMPCCAGIVELYSFALSKHSGSWACRFAPAGVLTCTYRTPRLPTEQGVPRSGSSSRSTRGLW